MNLAVPTGSDNWQVSVAQLLAIFKEHTRQPRLEYFDDLHPDLKIALEAAGFKQDMRAPVMVLEGKDFQKRQLKTRGRYRRLYNDEKENIEHALRRQSLAYGGTGDDSSLVWLPNLLKGLTDNSVMLAVLELGDFVSGASIQIGGGIGELAGVWTHPTEQKKGFAYSLCYQLLNDYFAEGYELIWLSAAEGAQRLYEKLGFKSLGTQLNYSMSIEP